MSSESRSVNQSPSVLMPTSPHVRSTKTSPMRSTMESHSILLSDSPHTRSPRSRNPKPRHEELFYPEREWAWILAPWVILSFVSFIFARPPSLGAYYRDAFYVKVSAISRRGAMALLKGFLHFVNNTPCLFWKVASWIGESWRNHPEFSQHITDRLPNSYAWMLGILAGVTPFRIVILTCLNRLLHLTKQLAIAGWTLMWRITQTCINELKRPVIWAWLILGNLLLIPMTCCKYLTWPMQAFLSEWWRRMLSYISSLTIFSWSTQQHLVNDWWRPMRQFRNSRLDWSGRRVLEPILLGVIVIFLIWGILETLSSPKYDGSIWAFLNARI